MDPVTFAIIFVAMIGLQFLIAALTPAQKPLDHIQISNSAFGETIPFFVGGVRVAGELCWLGILRSTVSKSKKIKTTNYFQSAFYVLGECGPNIPAQGVDRWWADGVVEYDARPGATPVNTYPSMTFEFFSGAEDQDPSITMEAEDGVGEVPAYRGVVSICLKDIPIHKHAYRLPNWNFQITSGDSTTPALDPVWKPLFTGTADPGWFSNFEAYITAAQHKYDYNAKRIYIASPKDNTYTTWQIAKVDGLTGDTLLAVDLPAGYGIQGTVSYAFDEGTCAMGCDWNGNYIFLFDGHGNDLRTANIYKIAKSNLATVHTYAVTDNGYPRTGGTGACNASGSMYCKGGGHGDNWRFPGQSGAHTYIHVINGNNYQTHDVQALYGITRVAWVLFDSSDVLYVYDGGSATLYTFTVDAAANITPVTSRAINSDMATYNVALDQIILAEETTNTIFHFLVPGTLVDARADTAVTLSWPFGQPWGGQWQNDGTFAITENTGSLPGTGNIIHVVDAYAGTMLDVDYNSVWPTILWYIRTYLPAQYYDASAGIIIGIDDTLNEVTLLNDHEGTEFIVLKLPGRINLQQVTEAALSLAGMQASDYDMSEGFPVVVRGALNAQRQAVRAFLGLLQPAYFFDIIEHGWKLVLRLRSNAVSVMDIPEDDVLAMDNNNRPKFAFTDPNSLEIPPWIDVSYFDLDRDFATGNVTARLPIASYRSTSTGTSAQLPVVLTADEAVTIGHRILDATWAERKNVEWPLSQKYLLVEPCDAVTLIRKGARIPVKIGEGNLSSKWAMQLKASSYDARVYDPARVVKASAPAYTTQVAVAFGAPYLSLIDTALLRAKDDHPGIYMQTQPQDSSHAVGLSEIFKSPDNVVYTDTDVQTGGGQGINAFPDFGSSTIPATLPVGYDTDTILVVNVMSGSLTTHTQDELLADPTLNLAKWGDELIQFGSVVQVSAGVWHINGIYHEQYGTEWAIGTQDMSSTFDVLDTATTDDFEYAPNELDGTYYYDARDTDHGVSSGPTSIVQTTRRLMPWAPVYPTGTRDGSFNLTTTFQFRSRMPGQPFWPSPVFGTDTFTFQADIYNGGTVVRTIGMIASAGGSIIDVTTDPTLPRVYYSAADQVTDFGSHQSSVHMKVYQLNSIRGRGYPGDFTV